MLLLDNVISAEEITQFKQYFINNFDKKYVNWAHNDDEIIDHRLTIDKNSKLFEIIGNIVSINFDTDNVLDYWSAYQRQSSPHNIHIDDYMSDQESGHRYTYILGMDTVPEFKAIVWKEKCHDNAQLHEFVANWGKLRQFKKKTSLISQAQDLEHTFDSNQQDYMADYLELDGIYQYQAGTACLFDATQLHCTSNWVKYQKFPYRELLQIHVLTAEPIAC
jgi:hypothetical protein